MSVCDQKRINSESLCRVEIMRRITHKNGFRGFKSIVFHQMNRALGFTFGTKVVCAGNRFEKMSYSVSCKPVVQNILLAG